MPIKCESVHQASGFGGRAALKLQWLTLAPRKTTICPFGGTKMQEVS